jgi:hypothetical protein
MDNHRLREARSLALHAAVADRLRADPEVISRARRRLEAWLVRGGASTPLLRRWAEILSQDTEKIAAFLTDPSEEAAWLRKASPFAGELEPRQRERILEEVRRKLESAA